MAYCVDISASAFALLLAGIADVGRYGVDLVPRGRRLSRAIRKSPQLNMIEGIGKRLSAFADPFGGNGPTLQ